MHVFLQECEATSNAPSNVPSQQIQQTPITQSRIKTAPVQGSTFTPVRQQSFGQIPQQTFAPVQQQQTNVPPQEYDFGAEISRQCCKWNFTIVSQIAYRIS